MRQLRAGISKDISYDFSISKHVHGRSLHMLEYDIEKIARRLNYKKSKLLGGRQE